VFRADAGARFTRADPEVRIASNGHGCGHALVDDGVRWRMPEKFHFEPIQGGPQSFDLDQDALCVVADGPCQREAGGETIDKRPKSDSLDHAPDSNATPVPTNAARALAIEGHLHATVRMVVLLKRSRLDVVAKYVVYPERSGKNGVTTQPFAQRGAPDEAPS